MNRIPVRIALLASLLPVIVLAGCRSFSMLDGQTQTIDPGLYMIGLDGTPLIDSGRGNCMLHQLEAREEGFRAGGTTGGLTLASAGATPVARPGVVSAHLEAVLGPTSDDGYAFDPWSGGDDVAILIVDDFGGHRFGDPVHTLGSALFEVAPGTDANEFEDLVAGWEESGELLHGPLVLYHTLALLAGLPGTQLESASAAKGAIRFSRGNVDVLVKAVDTQGFETQLIAGAIEDALEVVADAGFTRVVANMSFAIVPCSVFDDYRWARETLGVPGFEAYVEELTQVEENAPFADLEDELLDLVLTPVDASADPLHLLTRSTAHAAAFDALLFVASSGNYGLGYALAPAMWESVLAAAAMDVPDDAASEPTEPGTVSRYSNNGEVMLPATWTRVADAAGLSVDAGSVALDLIWTGTSSAAPALTVFSALDLAKGTPVCGLVDPVTPALAHPVAIEAKNWQATVPTLAEAVADYCTP